MVRANDIQLDPKTMKAKVSLEADTKAEVEVATPETIVGFPQGYTLDFFSKAFTASAELGIYQSDGTWNWGN